MSIYSQKIQTAERLANEYPKKAINYIENNFTNSELCLHISLIYSIALAHEKKTKEAIAVLTKTETRHPKSADLQFNLGLQKSILGLECLKHLKLACQLATENTYFSSTYLAAAQQLNSNTDIELSRKFKDKSIEISGLINQASILLSIGDIHQCRSILLQNNLNQKSEKANLVLAESFQRTGDLSGAIQYIKNAISINPSNFESQLHLAKLLLSEKDFNSALQIAETLISEDRESIEFLSILAASLVGTTKFSEAESVYCRIAELVPEDPRIYIRIGSIQKVNGKPNLAEQSFRKALSVDNQNTEAYWGIANLKMGQLTNTDILRMENILNKKLINQQEVFCRFSLGKAYEDIGDYKKSIFHYSKGNDLKDRDAKYNPKLIERNVKLIKEKFENTVINSKITTTPIFILGMPRSGSTLLEQILSCHSEIEPTMELNEITKIARQLDRQARRAQQQHYLDALNQTDSVTQLELGQCYLKNTEPLRKGKKYFIDKMPSNFIHIGLIKTILPQAKIIDIRRDPVACGFSIYKQLFSEGHNYAYSIKNIAHYYEQYLRLMKFWNDELPKSIFTLKYEDLTKDLEQQTTAILNFLGLRFQSSCLHFHNSKRSVATPSAEQVRQPLTNSSNELALNYIDHLQPLSILKSKLN